MRINQAAYFLTLFSLMLLATSSRRSSISGNEVQQSIRNGHGSGGGSSHGDGNGDSASSSQPGSPLNGAGMANNHNHHRNGAAINSPFCNFSFLAIAISFSLCVFLYTWA